MKRALLSFSAVFGLLLGYCSQPREIHAAGHQYAQRAEARPKDPSYPVEKRTCIECRQAAR
jgi:hypothetical protein